MLMEERELPIKFESIFTALPNQHFGEIIGINPRTLHTRVYAVKWQNGEVKHYKGGVYRPVWIKHLL